MKKYFKLVFLSFVCVPWIAQAQPTILDPVDVQGWFGTSLTLALKKKWEVGVDYQLRYQNNLTSYKGSYLSFSASKMVSKRFGFQGEYRLAKVAGSTFHRFSVGGEYEPAVPVVDVGLRVLFLNNIQDFIDPAATTQSDLYWRARLKVSKRLSKKTDLYVSVEPIMKFGGNSFVDNVRNVVGVKQRLFKSTKLDLFYMYRPDYAKSSYNRIYHVVGANLDFRLAAGKKKK